MLALALEQNDLVTIVEVLAEQPMLATTPFFDGTGEFPVMRALRLGCAPAVLGVLVDNGGDLYNSNSSPHQFSEHLDF